MVWNNIIAMKNHKAFTEDLGICDTGLLTHFSFNFMLWQFCGCIYYG
jgi:hypothetical protein